MPHVRIPPNIADIIRRSTIKDNVLHLPEQLSRGDYEVVKKTVENNGGRWKRGTGHVFDPGGIEKLLASLETGVARDSIKDRQAFYTPEPVASDMAQYAQCDGKTVLEPNIGGGNLVHPLIRMGAARIVGVEIDKPTLEHTEADLLARYPGTPMAFFHADFLTLDTKFLGTFDRVVMNPPFAKDADLDHIRHAWQFVKPGGRLVALTSPGWTFSERGKRGKFSTWLRELDGEHERLPDAEFGRTTIQVVRVVIEKPELTALESAMAELRAIA